MSIKTTVKRLGRIFVSLIQADAESLRQSVLVVDNGYSSIGHLTEALYSIKKNLPSAKISAITFEHRIGLFRERFADVEVIFPQRHLIRRYRIAAEMLGLCKKRFDYIVLLSLDITPIIVALLFTKARVLLYNRYHQWWSLRTKLAQDYLSFIPVVLGDIFAFFYLLVVASFIFVRRSFNMVRLNLRRSSRQIRKDGFQADDGQG
jgi:hypothetical protein